MNWLWRWLRARATVRPVGVDVVAHSIGSDMHSTIHALGAKRVRFTLYVARALVDEEYRADWLHDVGLARESGLEVLVVAHQVPAVLYDAVPTTAYVSFARLVAEVMAQVPGCDLQWFNECEADGYDHLFTRAGDPYDAGAAYAAFLAVATPLVRPHVNRVVTSGTGIQGLEGDFYNGLMTNARHGSFDVVAVHAYGFPVVLQYTRCYAAARQLWTGPVWCTEFGMDDSQYPQDWPTPDYDEMQRNALYDCYTQNPGYERQYLYVLQSLSERDTSFPVLRADGSRREAFTAIQQFNAGRR